MSDESIRHSPWEVRAFPVTEPYRDGPRYVLLTLADREEAPWLRTIAMPLTVEEAHQLANALHVSADAVDAAARGLVPDGAQDGPF